MSDSYPRTFQDIGAWAQTNRVTVQEARAVRPVRDSSGGV